MLMLVNDDKFYPKLSFQYTPYIFGPAPMPLIEVKFEKLPKPVWSLVDSGASMSIIHPKVASVAGIKFDIQKPITGSGVGSSYRYFMGTPIDITINHISRNLKFSVIANDDFMWGCILGHDFFKEAKVIFKTYKKEFDIFFRK